MFDKFQQARELLKLRQQAKKLQEELEGVLHTEESGGMRVTVNGAQDIVKLEFNGEERKDLRELINRAMKEVKKKSAKKMMEMEGGLSGILSKLGK